MPAVQSERQAQNHATFMLNFFDEVHRRVGRGPIGARRPGFSLDQQVVNELAEREGLPPPLRGDVLSGDCVASESNRRLLIGPPSPPPRKKGPRAPFFVVAEREGFEPSMSD
jgi:hypothetical protein